MDEELLKGLEPSLRLKVLAQSQRLDFWKWLLGTFLVAVASVTISYHFKQREITLAEKRQTHEVTLQTTKQNHDTDIEKKITEQKYLSEFLQYAISDDLESRIRFAHYFKSITQDTELKGIWDGYYQELLNAQAAQFGKPVESLSETERIGGTDAVRIAETERQITRVILGAEPNRPIGDIRQYHLSLGWSDVGFHFLVQMDGTVEIGRSLDQIPAFAQSFNSGAIAVALACSSWTNIPSRPQSGCEFTEIQKSKAGELVRGLVQQFGVSEGNILNRSDLRPMSPLLEPIFQSIKSMAVSGQ